MKVISSTGKEDVALVYMVEIEEGRIVECVEAVQPPLSREEKWVLMVSTLYGCPVGCQMCDAGGYYHGKLSQEEILKQIDFLVSKRYPEGPIPCQQFKIQFARMGEPSLNPAMLEVLKALPTRYDAPGLMPSFSTVAPRSTDKFFERLLAIKRELYPGGRFQFQYSIHTTDQALRDEIIPVKKWSFKEMAAYGERFYAPGDRKITLNFALAQNYPLDPEVLLQHFSPAKYLIKITPLNPTYQATENALASYIDPNRRGAEYAVVQALEAAGYQVILAVGEVEENYIGSNCGQYVMKHLRAKGELQGGYTYRVQEGDSARPETVS